MFLNTSNWVLLAPLAVVLYVGIRLGQGRNDIGNRSRSMAVIEGVIATIFVFGVIAVGVRMSWVTLAWCVVAGVACAVLRVKLRQLERMVLTESLVGVDTDESRGQVLREFAEESGGIGRAARRIVADLRKGVGVIDAMDRRRLVVGLYGRIRIRLIGLYGSRARDGQWESGEQPGRTTVWTLASVGAEVERITGRLFLVCPLLIILPLLHYFAVVGVPTFNSLSIEMSASGRNGPTSYFTWIDWYSSVIGVSVSGWVWVLAVEIALGLAFLILGTLWLFPGLGSQLGGRFLMAGYHRVACLLALSEILRHERDLGDALRRVPEVTRLKYLGVYFRRSADLLDAGQDVATALVRCRVLRPKEGARLRGLQDLTHIAWAIQKVGQQRAESMVRRLSIAVQAVVVTVVLVTGVIVGTLATGMFRLLVDMVESVM